MKLNRKMARVRKECKNSKILIAEHVNTEDHIGNSKQINCKIWICGTSIWDALQEWKVKDIKMIQDIVEKETIIKEINEPRGR